MKLLHCLFVTAIMAFALIDDVIAEDAILRGAGASFPYPMYLKWIKEYEAISKVRVQYESTGSGKGIERIMERLVDFAGSDAFLSEAEMEKAPGAILHIPTVLGAVVLTYNLPGQPDIILTDSVLVDIFTGQIKNWSDKRLRSINKDANLPNLPITVVHRSDGSGTTFIFTDYLSKISKHWKETVGRGKKVKWPVGIGVDKNINIVKYVKKVEGSLGYAELTYAAEHKLPIARIQNASGTFVNPSAESVSQAAYVDLPDDMRIIITNTDSLKGYPISGFTYILVYAEQSYQDRSKSKAQALQNFLWWVTHDAQELVPQMFYSPIPDVAVTKAENILLQMTYDGQKLRPFKMPAGDAAE